MTEPNKEEVSPKPDIEEDVALEGLLDRLDTLYLIDFNKKLIGFGDLEKATRTSVTNYTAHLQSRIAELEEENWNQKFWKASADQRIEHLESRLSAANEYLKRNGNDVEF